MINPIIFSLELPKFTVSSLVRCHHRHCCDGWAPFWPSARSSKRGGPFRFYLGPDHLGRPGWHHRCPRSGTCSMTSPAAGLTISEDPARIFRIREGGLAYLWCGALRHPGSLVVLNRRRIRFLDAA